MIITNYNTKYVRDISIHVGDIIYFSKTYHKAIVILGVIEIGDSLMIDFLDFEKNDKSYFVINKNENWHSLNTIIRNEN